MSRTTAGKGSLPKGMILLARGNRILLETVKDQIMRDPEEKRQQMLDVKLCDFDEVGYNIKIDKAEADCETPSPMIVAIDVPCFEDIKSCGTENDLKETYGDLVMDEPPGGYCTALSIDFDKLPEGDKEKEELIQNISTLKYHIMGAPFRKYFKELEEGKNCGKKFKYDIRSDTTAYICPGVDNDRVTIVYAVDFQEKVDLVIARVFMQELCDARKRIRTAPPFAWSSNPPTEINSMGVSENPGILGYASIAVMTAHIKGGNKDYVIAALVNFRTFLQYHIKCAKSYFHSRMRLRCSDLLKILNRAKVKFGKTEKKTKSGKTFKRN